MNRLKPTVLANNVFKAKVFASNAIASGMIKGTLLASLALLSVACSSNDSATQPAPSNNDTQNGIIAGNLEVTTANGSVKLRNTTEREVGYFVYEKNQAIVAMFPPCSANCPILKQGESVVIPFAQIGGYTPQATDAIVMWWKYTIRTDGSRVPEGGAQLTNFKLK